MDDGWMARHTRFTLLQKKRRIIVLHSHNIKLLYYNSERGLLPLLHTIMRRRRGRRGSVGLLAMLAVVAVAASCLVCLCRAENAPGTTGVLAGRAVSARMR
jgi:hypothetical protein